MTTLTYKTLVMKDGDCEYCDGCGYVDDGKDAMPFKEWLKLPAQSAVALQMGLVKPVECPECKGTGDAKAGQPSE